MGICSSSSVNVEEKKDSKDLVGAVGRNSKIDIETIPTERSSMVALEVLAGRGTIYRRKYGVTNVEDEFKSNEELLVLRDWLDEPVGRFYLIEYCTNKNFPKLLNLVLFWKDVQKLDVAEISLEDAVKGGQTEESEEEDVLAMRNSSGKLNRLYKRAQDDIKIILDAKEVVETYLKPESEKKLEFDDPELEKLMETTLADALDAIDKGDHLALRKEIFKKLQNAAVVGMYQGELHKTFKEHSEYKRYVYKYKRVYNFISHWDFDFMQTLGKGSFGRVIRVRKKTTKKQYALKVMSKKKILSGAENSSQVTIERQVLYQCDSKYVVGLHFAFQTSRALFIALDLLEGGTLVEAMHRSGGRMEMDAVKIISAQIILGLNHLHEHGILYRDLKPVNVMLDSKGNAVLTDMGLCAKFRPSIYERDEVEDEDGVKPMEILKPNELKCVGTYGYRAPEVLAVSSKNKKKRKTSVATKKTKTQNDKDKDSQTETDGVTAATDVDERKGYGTPVDYWALGVTMYYLLMAKYPFRPKVLKVNFILPSNGMKGTEEKLQRNIPNWNSEFDDQDVVSVLKGLLEKDPADRLDFDRCREQPFFSSIDWDALEAGKVTPVYKPKVPKHTPDEKPRFEGLSDAMKQFAHENVLELFGGENDMQDEYKHVRSKHQKLFRDWDRIPDHLLEEDWNLVDKDDLSEAN